MRFLIPKLFNKILEKSIVRVYYNTEFCVMANVLKVCAETSSDCKSLCITDVSGVYSTSNLGGWGAPNATIAMAQTASVILSKRNQDGTYSASTSGAIDAYPTLPNTSETEFCITAEDFGYGSDATFEDGIYKVQYIVTGVNGITPFTFTTEIVIVISCAIDCCVKKLSLKVSTCPCDCEELGKKQRELMIYYRLLKSAICCASLTEIQLYLDKLKKLCSFCSCNC